MTRADIEARIAAIADEIDDYEAAHSMEDDLYLDVLSAIADGTLDGIAPADAAALVLETQHCDFPRYCA